MNPAEFLSVLHARHCQRAFLDKPVERDVIEAVLLAAGQAPSGKNSQPWKVTVVTGARRDVLSDALCAAFDAGDKGKADYEYSLLPHPVEWMDRARAKRLGKLAFTGNAPRNRRDTVLPGTFGLPRLWIGKSRALPFL